MITNRSQALGIVQARFGSLPVDAEFLLDASSVTVQTTPDIIIAYRPFYTVAMLISVNWIQFKSVTSAAGSSVVYESPNKAIQAYLELQGKLDSADKLNVPDEFKAGYGNQFEVVM